MTTPTHGYAWKRILIVDDDEQFRLVLVRVLRSEGYAVTEAGDGVEAVRLVCEHAPGYYDCVVMDYIMPLGLTGGEAANGMRRCNPNQPVVYLSGFPDFPEDLKSCEAFLSKPAAIDDIVEAIERLSGCAKT